MIILTISDLSLTSNKILYSCFVQQNNKSNQNNENNNTLFIGCGIAIVFLIFLSLIIKTN